MFFESPGWVCYRRIFMLCCNLLNEPTRFTTSNLGFKYSIYSWQQLCYVPKDLLLQQIFVPVVILKSNSLKCCHGMIAMFLITCKSFKYLHSLEIQEDLTTACTTQGWPKHWQKSFLYSKSILFSGQLLELTANISFGTAWDFRTEHREALFRGTLENSLVPSNRHWSKILHTLHWTINYSKAFTVALRFGRAREKDDHFSVSSSFCEKELTLSQWSEPGQKRESENLPLASHGWLGQGDIHMGRESRCGKLAFQTIWKQIVTSSSKFDLNNSNLAQPALFVQCLE